MAYVGCHEGTINPLGRLANAELRHWKKEAHAAFDPIWQYGRFKGKRNEAYSWLAKQMGLPKEKAHIGMFDVSDCKRVIQICKKNELKEKIKMDEKKTYEYKGTVTIGTDEYRDLVSECATCKVTSDEYRSRLWSEQATVLTLKNELKELKSEAEKLRTFINSDREHRLAYRQFIAEVEDNKDA